MSYDEWIIGLFEIYCNTYKRDGKLFIRMFLTCPSVRENCKRIMQVMKKNRIWEECQGDFSEYVKRYDTDQNLLNEILITIYSATKK